jgi:hypothetical protein
MQKLGIYTSTIETTSTTPIVSSISIAPLETSLATIGNIVVVGLTVGYTSYVKYYNLLSFGTSDFSLFSNDTCVLYESVGISGTSVSVDVQPVDNKYTLEVTITPGSSTTTKWTVYYRDFYYELT